MKRMGAALLAAVLLCALLAGCKRSNAGQNFGEIVAGRYKDNQNRYAASNSESLPPPEPIPIVTYQNGNFGPTLGFTITQYPNNATLSPTKFFALDGWFSQIEFVSNDEKHLVLRTAFTDAGYLTITYKELHDASDTSRDVGGVEVRTRNAPSGCSMVTWNQGEFQFLLHSNAAQGPLPTDLVDMVVSGTVAQAV